MLVYLLASYQQTSMQKVFRPTGDENMHVIGTSHEIVVDTSFDRGAVQNDTKFIDIIPSN